MSLLLMLGVVALTIPSAEVQATGSFASCEELHGAYPHGVARDRRATDLQPIRALVSSDVYLVNELLDVDGDGVACELAASTSVPMFLSPDLDPKSRVVKNIRRSMIATYAKHRIPAGKDVILFGPSDSAVNWAVDQTSKSPECYSWVTPQILHEAIGFAGSCGVVMKVLDESWPHVMKDMRTTARHEAFHTYQGDVLQACDCWDRTWMIEGAADVVGYFDHYGRSKAVRRQLLDTLAPFAKLAGQATFSELDASFGDDSIAVDARYSRAFLAVMYLSELTSRDKALFVYLDNLLLLGEEDAFVATFGFTEDHFDRRFRTWLARQ